MTTVYEGLDRQTDWFRNLQANILRPHGRSHQRMALFTWGAAKPTEVAAWIRSVPVTSMARQLEMADAFRKGDSSGYVVSLFLSADGYRALGYAEDDLPNDPAFRQGMKARAASLGDPKSADWAREYQGSVHAALMVAGDTPEGVHSQLQELLSSLVDVAGESAVLTVEEGSVTRGEAGSIEHFGFADGLSNPRFLQDDIARQGERTKFDERAPKEIAIVGDPLSPSGFGSYAVVRKIRQDVDALDAAVSQIAERVGQGSDSEEHAAAMFVGRFRDGRSLAMPANADDPKINDFDYLDDPSGQRTPLHAHARKMNDRLSSLAKGAWHGETRRRRIVRRGFNYGGAAGDPSVDRSAVGLIFVSFQASIEQQFEHLLRRFANDPDYPNAGTGVDPLIGTTDRPTEQHWPTGEASGKAPFSIDRVTDLLGGEYLFAPSITFLSTITCEEKAEPARRGAPSSARVARLRQRVIDTAFGSRKSEWFTTEMCPNILEARPELARESVIVRKAHACCAMLEAMTNATNSKSTRSFEIEPGELIVGRMPLGSVGLGKVFPGYLTEEERRVSSFCNRDEPSVFGHTVPNYRRVLEDGLAFYRDDAKKRASETTGESAEFYRSVSIVCEGIIGYANRFADRADALAASESDPSRKAELEEIARVCRRVPAEPAKTFHEAVQCVWFVHLAQSSFACYNSLGRLDQTLGRYSNPDDSDRELELLECFFVKGAERLHLDPSKLKDSDNLSYGTGIGTQPIYLDQVASSNNYIQNIVVGGVTPNGDDATNGVTHLFLEACGNVALCTPTLNVRLHSDTPKELYQSIERCFRTGRTGLPILYNDDSIVGGLVSSGIPLEEARDYSCAGCWEPVLNGKCSFIFGMVNMLQVLECTLAEGTRVTDAPMFLRGRKQSPRAPHPSEITSFEILFEEFVRQMNFFADKVALGTGAFYLLPGEVTPTPFLSLLLDGCYERGVDQSRGGADYNLAGNLAFAVPNAINSLANIDRFVFREGRWTLEEVVDAMRRNWGVAPVRSQYESGAELDADRRKKMQEMRVAFLRDGEKWGNGVDRVEDLGMRVMDAWHAACTGAAELCERTFLSDPDDANGRSLRGMANYQGPSLKKASSTQRGGDFRFHFTHGSGTFGQYSSMGIGVAASADGRAANEPIAPNCSPPGGTGTSGLSELFASLGRLGLERFGCAVVTDIRVDGTDHPKEYFERLARSWQRAGGSMMTVSCLSSLEMEEAFRVSEKVRAGIELSESLKPYCDLMCRVGGWNSSFVCLPLGQQRDHLLRATW